MQNEGPCGWCPYQYFYFGVYFCSIEMRAIYDYYNPIMSPSWCPLKLGDSNVNISNYTQRY